MDLSALSVGLDTMRDAASGAVHGAMQSVQAAQQKRRKMPEKIHLVDIFNRKLYDKVDFNYVIKYLRDNNLAKCSHLYTLDDITHDVLPKIAGEGLQKRSVSTVAPLFAGIMVLCKRRRKGLLAYLSLVGSPKACLIKSWQSLLEYGEFNYGVDIADIWLDPCGVFPSMKLNKSLTAQLNRQVAATNNKFERERLQQVARAIDQPQEGSKPQAVKLEDLNRELPDIDLNDSTTLFSSGKIDSGQLLALSYKKVVAGEMDWSDLHAFDTFLYYLFYIKTEAKRIVTITAFMSDLQSMFKEVGVILDSKFLSELSGGYLHGLRLCYGLADGKGKSEPALNKAVRELAKHYLQSGFADESASWREIYEHEIKFIEKRHQDLLSKINAANYVLYAGDKMTKARCEQIMPDYADVIEAHNTDVFNRQYASVIDNSDILWDDAHSYDNLLLYMVYQYTNDRGLCYRDVRRIVLQMISDKLPNYTTDLARCEVNSSGGVLNICRALHEVPPAQYGNNALAYHLLYDLVNTYFNTSFTLDVSCKDVYDTLRTTVLPTTSSNITVASAADLFSSVDSQEDYL